MYILLKQINAIVNTLELYSSLIFYIYIYWNWNWMILEGKQNINKISKIFHFNHWTLRIETITKIQDVSPMEKKPIHNYIYEI